MTSKTNLTEPDLNSLNWNVPLNANFGTIDTAFSGVATYTFSNSNLTINTSDLPNFRFLCIGTLSANCNLVIPANIAGFWMVSNFTSGGFSFNVVSAGGGTSLQIAPGYSAIIYCDGTNVYNTNGYSSGTASGGTPIGTVAMYAANATPPGWLLCDGTSYSTTGIYANLYNTIGYVWGGSGANFNVPDLRGMFVRGTGTNAAYPTAVGGSIGSSGYQVDLYLNHNHTATSVDAGHTHTYTSALGGNQAAQQAGGPQLGNVSSVTGTGNANITTTVATSTTGGAETRPKNFALWYIIKY